jgi:Amt family ammonium transporter
MSDPKDPCKSHPLNLVNPPSWPWLGLPLTTLLVVFSHASVLSQTQPTNSPLTNNTGILSLTALINNLWILLAFLLVMAMYGGFAFLTAGLCRSKNVVNILLTHLMIWMLTLLVFWGFGFAFMFGSQGNGWLGNAPWFLGSDNVLLYGLKPFPQGLPLTLFFLFQSALAGLTAMIVAGAVAERVKFGDFLIFTIALVGLGYAIVGHWVWGGGWLAKMGFQDFAGSTVIHCVGGWAAFSGLAILGPRMGKYETRHINRLAGHNLSLAFLGCLLLWLGWFGLIGGKGLTLTPTVPVLILTANLAAIASGLVALFIGWWRSGKPDLALTIRGILAGLVAISGSCNQISFSSAIIIGAIAGLLTVSFLGWFDRVHLDDPVGMLSIHLVGGLWGTIAVGIFDLKGGLIRGQSGLLLNQLIGIAAIGVFIIIFSGLVWLLLKVSNGLRVDLEGEINGLDISEHGQSAYPEFLHSETSNTWNPYEPIPTPEEPVAAPENTPTTTETAPVQTPESSGEREIETMNATLESDDPPE